MSGDELAALRKLRATLDRIEQEHPDAFERVAEHAEEVAGMGLEREGEGETARRLRRIRESWGLSQRGLSALLGLAPATVGRWEAGERDPGPLAEALAVLIESAPVKARRLLEAEQRKRAES